MNYFIVKDGIQSGPFSIEELYEQGITASTPVWHAGMPDWTVAQKVEELQPVLMQDPSYDGLTPPPIYPSSAPQVAPLPGSSRPGSSYQGTSTRQGNTDTCPKTWMVESILVILFCCLPFGIVGLVYACKVSSLFAQGNYEDAVKASNDAGKWTKTGFFVGLGAVVLYTALTAR